MSNEARDYDNDVRESIKDICRCEEVCPGENYVLIEKEPCIVKCLLDACQISSTELTSMTITAGEWREKCEGLEKKRGCHCLRCGVQLHPICNGCLSDQGLPQQEKEE